MGAAADRGIAISFLSLYGKFLARVQGPVSGNVLLRREQYRIADDRFRCAKIATAIVTAKIANGRRALQRARLLQSDSRKREELEKAINQLAGAATQLGSGHDLDSIRGHEGEAASTYFSVLDHLIRTKDPKLRFTKRSRRPPEDPVNALLSFFYTLLVSDVSGALESVGLDPQVGFLHRDRPGRPSLSLDIMEEFRAFLCDRLVLTMVNRGQVKGTDFKLGETGGVIMKDKLRGDVLAAYQERKKKEIRHPFLNEKMTVGMMIHIQARLLARHIRGDLDNYPPFLWR